MKLIRILLVVGVMVLSFAPQAVWATEGAEVFDIIKGEVVATIPNSDLLQNQVKSLLSSVVGVAGVFRIEPNDGIAIKVKLAPPYRVRNQWITGTVKEVIVIVGRNQTYAPTMLVFMEDHHFLGFHVNSDTLTAFLKGVNLYSSELDLGTSLHER